MIPDHAARCGDARRHSGRRAQVQVSTLIRRESRHFASAIDIFVAPMFPPETTGQTTIHIFRPFRSFP